MAFSGLCIALNRKSGFLDDFRTKLDCSAVEQRGRENKWPPDIVTLLWARHEGRQAGNHGLCLASAAMFFVAFRREGPDCHLG